MSFPGHTHIRLVFRKPVFCGISCSEVYYCNIFWSYSLLSRSLKSIKYVKEKLFPRLLNF